MRERDKKQGELSLVLKIPSFLVVVRCPSRNNVAMSRFFRREKNSELKKKVSTSLQAFCSCCKNVAFKLLWICITFFCCRGPSLHFTYFKI